MTEDYRNPIVAEAMKVLGFVNRFSRGVVRVKNIIHVRKRVRKRKISQKWNRIS